MELLKLLETNINENKFVKLEIYSLEYVIELKDGKYIIYAELYKNRKSEYKSLKELFNSYMIYNEPIIQSIDKIKIIN